MKHKNHKESTIGNHVEEMNYNTSNSTIDDGELKIVAEPVEYNFVLYGRVIGCSNLNIRRAPNPQAEIVMVVPKMAELKIDSSNSNDDWYAVCTASGIDGFCMKKFVDIIL